MKRNGVVVRGVCVVVRKGRGRERGGGGDITFSTFCTYHIGPTYPCLLV
jgi:hypothetical protein